MQGRNPYQSQMSRDFWLNKLTLILREERIDPNLNWRSRVSESYGEPAAEVQ